MMDRKIMTAKQGNRHLSTDTFKFHLRSFSIQVIIYKRRNLSLNRVQYERVSRAKGFKNCILLYISKGTVLFFCLRTLVAYFVGFGLLTRIIPFQVLFGLLRSSSDAIYIRISFTSICYLTGRMLEAITGGKPLIKYLQQENGTNV